MSFEHCSNIDPIILCNESFLKKQNAKQNSQNTYSVRLKPKEEKRWFYRKRLKLITKNELENIGLNFSRCNLLDVASLRSNIIFSVW